jgi:hypothetical protein
MTGTLLLCYQDSCSATKTPALLPRLPLCYQDSRSALFFLLLLSRLCFNYYQDSATPHSAPMTLLQAPLNITLIATSTLISAYYMFPDALEFYLMRCLGLLSH